MKKPIWLALSLSLSLSLALAFWGVVAQGESTPSSRPVLAQAADNNDCLTNCRNVLELCNSICRDGKARDRDAEYGDADRRPVDPCIKDCEQDYTICKQSC